MYILPTLEGKYPGCYCIEKRGEEDEGSEGDFYDN